MEEGLHRRDRENCSSLITNSLADIESSLQRDAEAAYTHAEVRPPKRVARLELAAAVQTSPEGVSWMWPPAGHRPGVIFFSAWPTPFPCLQLQPASLGTDQLPPGCRREQEQAAAPWASPPPPSRGVVGFRGQRRPCCSERVMSLRGRLGSAGKLGAFD